MTDKHIQRRLAAILAADVVGYSRLMEQDEAGTLAAVRQLRAEVIEPKIVEHQGRLFKTMGDGFLVEFPSVVNAVACAVAIQKAMAAQNADLPEDRAIQLRIGVNLGDVIVEGDDVFGDGVNVAARIEGNATPGEIIISASAHDQIGNRLVLSFEDLGEQKLKNIETPVRLYQVYPGSSVKPLILATKSDRTLNWRIMIASLVLLAAAIGGTGLWFGMKGSSPSVVEIASKDRMELPLPAKPSIAVLPFTNMSSDPEQEHFVDGMTDDLITDLSKISDLFVIARNSTFVYKDRAVKISQVAQELGVRYVLEGSVQRKGDQLRVNAQLIDALTGGHVWADRFDGSTSDLFAAQDAFLSKIVAALKITLTSDEKQEIASARTDNLQAKEAFDEGWNLYLRYNAHDTRAAIELLKKATELDPEYGRAYAALALAYFRAFDSLWAKEIGIEYPDLWFTGLDYLELAKKFPTSLSHTAKAMYNVYSGPAQAARQEAGRAIALDPNDPEAHIAMAWALTISGEPEDALSFVATAMRLNPSYPSHYALARGAASLTMGNLTQAAEALGNGLVKNPHASMLLVPYSSILAQLGRREEARQALLRFRSGIDQRGLENFADTYDFPFKWDEEHLAVRERLIDGLRLAALPLDVTVQSLDAVLRAGNVFEQMRAIRRLSWFGPASEQAVPALIEALKNKNLQKDAIKTLGKIGPQAKAAVPDLLAFQDDALTSAYARDALLKIRGY